MQESPPIKNGEESLLSACPWCRYALEGLPVEHVCPECGEAFDRQWRMYEYGEGLPPIGPARFWYLLAMGFSGVCAYPMMALVVLDVFGFDLGRYDKWRYFYFLPVIIWVLVEVLCRDKTHYLLLTPQGVVLCDRLKKSRQITPWTEVLSTARAWHGTLFIQIREKRVYLAGMRHEKDCMIDIEKWRRLHQVA